MPTGPVTYVLYMIGSRFEALEDERTLMSRAAFMDFAAQPHERTDSLLTRFDMARHEAQAVGAGIDTFQTLSTLLLRAIGISGQALNTLLTFNQGRIPTNQQQYEAMVVQIR